MKIGIFGGSFNPPHMGHTQSVEAVATKTGLDKVIIIPNFLNPLKHEASIDESTRNELSKHRLEMCKLAFLSMGPKYEVSPIEIERGGNSFTIDTVKLLKQKNAEDSFQLIMGVDNFLGLSLWHKWEELLNEVDFIITSRPGWDLPYDLDTLPKFILPYVAEFDFNSIVLKSGHIIQFVSLKDTPISATEIRRNIQVGKAVVTYLSLEVENYIKQNNVYPLLREKVSDYKVFAKSCFDLMEDRKALSIRAFDLRTVLRAATLTDYAIIASGTSSRHVSSIAEYLKIELKKKYNILPQAVEGLADGKWVVMDYGNLIVHIFYDYVRQAYALEQMWTGAKEIDFAGHQSEQDTKEAEEKLSE